MGQRTLTSTARRRLIGLGLAGLVVVTACSSGSTDEPGASDTTPPTNPPATTAPGPDTTESTAPATPTTEPSVAPDETAEPAPTLAELEAMAFDGEIPEIDVALTEFSVVTGVDIDGALPVTVDAFVPDELTSVVMRLQVLDDQLTDQQRRQIDDYLDEIRSSAELIVDSTTLEDPDQSADAGDQGSALGIDHPADARISAFAGARNRPSRVTDSEFAQLVRNAQAYVMGQLGGNVPNQRFSWIGKFERVGRQRNWAGWASTTEDRVDGTRKCDVFIVDFPDNSDEALWTTIVHEYFHCWHGANFPGPIDDYYSAPNWVKEGLAEWVASEVSETRHAANWAQAFLDAPTGRLFGSSYAAVAFYWQLNYIDGGNEALWSRIPSIIENSGNAGSFRAATNGLDPIQIAELASTSTRKASWGDPWIFDAQRLDRGARPIQQRSVRATAYEFARPGEQVAVEFDVVVAADEPAVIELVQEGLTISAWYQQPSSTFRTNEKTQWCLNSECVCENGEPIPDAQPIPGNDPRLVVALTGGATEQASTEVSVATLDDACEPDTGDADPELTGIWIAKPAAVVEAYDQAFEQIGVSVTGAAGELSLTLYSDSTAELRYDEMRLGLSDPFLGEVTIHGKGTLDWGVEEGQLVFSGLANFTVSMYFPKISEDPFTISDEDLPPLGPEAWTMMEYVRTGSSLSMSNIVGSLADLPDGSTGALVFPLAWTRAGDAPASG